MHATAESCQVGKGDKTNLEKMLSKNANFRAENLTFGAVLGQKQKAEHP